MEHEVGFFANPHTWVNIGGLIFLAFAGPKIWKALTQMLDQRAIKIKADLDEAQKLKDEAQALLGEYQRKQKDALREASEIIETAKLNDVEPQAYIADVIEKIASGWPASRWGRF